MKENFLVRFLPPPNFLLMPTFGVDICDSDIRLACLENSSNGLKIKHVVERPLAQGVVVGGRVEKPDELSQVFEELAESFCIQYASWALPEGLTYVITMRLPPAAKEHLRESVELQLEEYVPVQIGDVSFDVDVIDVSAADKSGVEVAVGVAAKRDVHDCINICWRSGVVLRSLELESQSLARALIKKGDDSTYMIVDFGKRYVAFAVVMRGVVTLTSSIPALGGDALTKVMQKNSSLTFDQIEELKMKDGLAGLDKNSDLFFTVMSHLGSLRDEIVNRMQFWQTKNSVDIFSPVTKIILCGSQALIPGLLDYLADSLEVKVEMGNPMINLVDDSKQKAPLGQRESLHFAKAIGLALRHLAYGH